MDRYRHSAATAVSDRMLVEAARLGSREAFAALVERYHGPVVRFASGLTRDADEASDVAQDAFLRAYRAIGTFRADRPFARWLFTIARNASFDAVRRRRAPTGAMEEAASGGLGPEELVLREEDAVRVRAALAALPRRYRQALELRYVSGLRYRDIAAALDVPIGTVKTHLARAKRRLRAEYDEAERAA